MKDVLVYIAGPISKGDTISHIKHALGIAEMLEEKGYTTYPPQLTAFWHLVHPHDHQWWLEHDFVLLKRCDCLLRLPGVSDGADQEVEFCMEHGIPVFYNIDAMDEWRTKSESQGH